MIDDLSEPPPRTVCPRKRTYARLPVMAIHGDETLNEDGEVGTVRELIRGLRKMRATLFVAEHAADFVGDLDKEFSRHYPSKWQWRARENEMPIVQPDGLKVASRITVVVNWFGFRGNHNETNVYHKIIDPVSMFQRDLDKVMSGPYVPRLMRLLQFGVAIRDLCDENDIEVRPTTGAISSQFLTDPRFYPHARRKVPRATNDNIRERLPGNFYHLWVIPKPERVYTAYYIDQRRAHHYHARTSPMPDSNGLYAYGRFIDLAAICFTETRHDFSGLYCLDLDVPPRRRGGTYVAKWLQHHSTDTVLERRYIYSNELDFLTSLGYRVRGVRAAWGSVRQDTGLAKYSEWAETQLDRYDDAPWLKQLLLSTYGTLATRPQIQQSVFRQATRGKPVSLHTGRNTLTGLQVRGRMKLEPGYANVLHRGLIEAGARIEVISYAHYLISKGYRPLAIYGDGVIVEVNDDIAPPIMPPPWRLQETLTHWQPWNLQQFTSDQMTKMPGGFRGETKNFRQETPGHAPRNIRKYEAVTGHPIWVNTITKQKVT